MVDTVFVYQGASVLTVQANNFSHVVFVVCSEYVMKDLLLLNPRLSWECFKRIDKARQRSPSKVWKRTSIDCLPPNLCQRGERIFMCVGCFVLFPCRMKTTTRYLFRSPSNPLDARPVPDGWCLKFASYRCRPPFIIQQNRKCSRGVVQDPPLQLSPGP